jgi:hypothetical protein
MCMCVRMCGCAIDTASPFQLIRMDRTGINNRRPCSCRHHHTTPKTSPVRSNPDTFIIQRVLASFGLVPGLGRCRKLIVCDGYQVAANGGAPK